MCTLFLTELLSLLHPGLVFILEIGRLAGARGRLELAPTDVYIGVAVIEGTDDGSGWCIRCCGHSYSCSDVNIPPESISMLIRPHPQLSPLYS